MKPMLRTLLLTIMLISAPAGAEITMREQADRALTRLDGAIAKSPKTALYTERGDIYYQLNDFRRAIEDYNAALKLDDQQSKVYFGRGMAYGRMGMMDEGIADLGVYIARHPTDSVAYTKRGVRNIWRGNL